MKIYTLYSQNSDNSLESLKVVSEGFCISAFIFNLLWLVYHQLWDYFIVCSLFVLCIVNLYEYEIIPFSLLNIATIFLACLIGAIGNDIIRADLEKKGFNMVEIVAASSADEARLKFINTFLSKKKKNAKPGK